MGLGFVAHQEFQSLASPDEELLPLELGPPFGLESVARLTVGLAHETTVTARERFPFPLAASSAIATIIATHSGSPDSGYGRLRASRPTAADGRDGWLYARVRGEPALPADTAFRLPVINGFDVVAVRIARFLTGIPR